MSYDSLVKADSINSLLLAPLKTMVFALVSLIKDAKEFDKISKNKKTEKSTVGLQQRAEEIIAFLSTLTSFEKLVEETGSLTEIVDYWYLKSLFLKQLRQCVSSFSYIQGYNSKIDKNNKKAFYSNFELKGNILLTYDFFKIALSYDEKLPSYINHKFLLEFLNKDNFYAILKEKRINYSLNDEILTAIKQLTASQLDEVLLNPRKFNLEKMIYLKEIDAHLDKLAPLPKNLSYFQSVLKNLIIVREHTDNGQLDKDPLDNETIQFLLNIRKKHTINLEQIDAPLTNKIYAVTEKYLRKHRFDGNNNNVLLLRNYNKLMNNIQSFYHDATIEKKEFNKNIIDYLNESDIKFTNIHGQTNLQILWAQLTNLFELIELKNTLKGPHINDVNSLLKELEPLKQKLTELERNPILIDFLKDEHKRNFLHLFVNTDNFKAFPRLLKHLFKNKWQDKEKTRSFLTYYFKYIQNFTLIPLRLMEKNLTYDDLTIILQEQKAKTAFPDFLVECSKRKDLFDWVIKNDFINHPLLKGDDNGKYHHNGLFFERMVKNEYLLKYLPYYKQENVLLEKEQDVLFWLHKDKNVLLSNVKKTLLLLTIIEEPIYQLLKDSIIDNPDKDTFSLFIKGIEKFSSNNGDIDLVTDFLERIKEKNKLKDFIFLTTGELNSVITLTRLYHKDNLLSKQDIDFFEKLFQEEYTVIWNIAKSVFNAGLYPTIYEEKVFFNELILSLDSAEFIVNKKTLTIDPSKLFKRNLILTV